MMSGNLVLRSVFALALCMVASSSVYAQEGFKPSFNKPAVPATNPSEILGYTAGEYQKTEDVTLLGKSYTLTFWQMPESTMTWDDAKSYLPSVVTEKPKTPVSDDKLLEYISQLATNAALNYDKYAQEDFQANKARHMAEHPGLPEETVSVLIFEQYHGNNGWKNSKRAQEAHNTYLALMYVEDALRLKMGLIQKNEPAPKPGASP